MGAHSRPSIPPSCCCHCGCHYFCWRRCHSWLHSLWGGWSLFRRVTGSDPRTSSHGWLLRPQGLSRPTPLASQHDHTSQGETRRLGPRGGGTFPGGHSIWFGNRYKSTSPFSHLPSPLPSTPCTLPPTTRLTPCYWFKNRPHCRRGLVFHRAISPLQYLSEPRRRWPRHDLHCHVSHPL